MAAVAVADPFVVEDYVEKTSRLLEKITARCWPGPLILRVGEAGSEGLSRAWPESSQAWGVEDGGRAVACPSDDFTRLALRALPAPLLCVFGSGEVPSHDAIELVVRQESTRFDEPPTIARIRGDALKIERSGAISQRMLSRQAGEIYLFVCTGNTCRSPMAEAIFRKMLAERLKCREDELLDRGFAVISAGLAAYRGAAASPEAVDLLRDDGIDLSSHESQPVTADLLFHCDHILTMTRSHREAVLSAYPELQPFVRLLSPDARDVVDPIGAGIEEYVRCREEITECLQRLLQEIEFQN